MKPLAFLTICCGLSAQNTLTVVSTPSYAPSPLAPGAIVSMFAPAISTGVFVSANTIPNALPLILGGASATLTDSSGIPVPIPLLAVTPGQVNAVLPDSLRPGAAVVTLTTSAGMKLSCSVILSAVAPALFTADQSGGWLAAAQVVIAHSNGTQSFMPAIADCTGPLAFNGMTWSHCSPIPINLGSTSDVAVLELFGSGIRAVTSVSAMCPGCGYIPVQTQGRDLPVLFAGAQAAGASGAFYGLDQVNIQLPHSLAGLGILRLSLNVLAGFLNGAGIAATSNTVYAYIQ